MLSRFFISSRKRPEHHFEHCFCNFEFTVVPRSLFTSDGEFAKINGRFSTTLELGAAQVRGDGNGLDEKNVLVIDGMAVLNQIHKIRDTKKNARLVSLILNFQEVLNNVKILRISTPKHAEACKRFNG